METVRAYTRDVIVELTRILLELFAQDKVQTTIDSCLIFCVVWPLSDLNDDSVEQCVPDDFVPHILRLAEKLETASDYHNDCWERDIKRCARQFREKVIRVKHNPETM